MKKKKIYNSKTIRISLGDYALLDGISQQARITFAEALHQLITAVAEREAEREAIVVPRAQIPMPAFRAYPQPALRVSVPIPLRVSPQPALRVYPQPTMRGRVQPTIAINGNKAVAIGIKTRGVKYA